MCLAFAILGSPNANAQCAYPDDDRTRWGWDNAAQQSCPPSSASSPATDNAAGNCSYPNNDTSQWGWDDTAKRSCAPIASGGSASGDDSDNCQYPNNDTSQWGWDDIAKRSCAPVAFGGSPSGDDVDSCVYPGNDTSQWGWDDIAKRSCAPVASGAGPSVDDGDSCVYPNNDTSQWGWDAIAKRSCAPVANNNDAEVAGGNCVYPDGDVSQWGWNDVTSTSCQPLNNAGGNAEARAYPYSINPTARVSHDWSTALRKTWAGLKQRNIDRYNTGMVHRPRSEQPGDAVSEGIGYGMILALYSNDQTYFNKIWDAGERVLWNGRLYDWRSDQFGNIIGTGAATDAEQDIAMMLIFADHLVDLGLWSPHVSPQGADYATRAQDLLDLIWSEMIDGGRYLRPGNFWGGRDLTNIGYFSPAWYRLYQQFDARDDHNWQAVIDQGYQTISAGAGYGRGLVADWSDARGNTLAEGPGYNAYDNGHSMFKDGIRIYWRLAADALWFREGRATRFLNNALNFLEQQAASGGTSNQPNSPAHLANFYQLNGDQVPVTDVWTEFNGGNSQRSRNEHSHLTLGMWASAAIGTGGAGRAESFSRQLQTFYEGGDFWGKSVDATGRGETIDNNEMYFDQFLAWFGAMTLNGNFCNILTCVNE
jgi:endo-1,4-beta-D-glucanase Y